MSTYKILLPILIIMLVFGLLANLKGNTQTGALKGVLSDSQTGQPVSYAKIELLGTKFKTQTDDRGEFSINNIPAQEYNLKITAKGYCGVTIVRTQIQNNRATVINYELIKLAKKAEPRIISLYASDVQKFEKLTGTLTGKIIDPNGEPVPGATVQFDGTRLGAQTDIDGNYIVNNVPIGQYSTKIRLVGYKTKIVPEVAILEDTEATLDVQMEETVINSNKLRGDTKSEIDLDEACNIRIIKPHEIKQSGSRNLQEILKTQTGVTISGTTGTICGQIVDIKTNEPIAGATVSLEGTTIGAQTNINGIFVINYVPPGEYLVRILKLL